MGQKVARSRQFVEETCHPSLMKQSPKIKDVKTVVGNHSVSCDTTVYVPGCVGGTLLTCCLKLVQQRRLYIVVCQKKRKVISDWEWLVN